MTEQAQETTQQAQPEQVSSFSIPSEYKDAGWSSKISSYDDLWKGYANSQSLLGKRPAGIPQSDAPEEEWNKFYTAIGRPEKADGYTFDSEFEGISKEELAPYESKMKSLAHEIGLSPSQAKKAWEKYINMEIEASNDIKSKLSDNQKELDKQYDELSKKYFGDKYDVISKQAQDFIRDALPEELRPALNSLENNPQALLAVIKISEHAKNEISKIANEYGKEDRLNSGTSSTPSDVNEVKKNLIEARDRAQKAAPFSPERKQAESDLDMYRKQLAKIVNV